MGAITSLVGPAISLGSSLFGLSQGVPASNVQLPSPQQYPGVQLPSTIPAFNEVMTGSSALQGYNPLFQNLGAQGRQTLSNIYNNPGAAGYTAGAGTASDLGMNAALAQYGLGGNLAGYGGQALNTGFDPQNALYARTLQQLQDQTRAGQAARGISMSPYGAGLENQSLSNFNIDWQNAQLQRQLSALQGGGAAYGQGASLMGGAAPLYLQSAGMPYGVSQQMAQDQFGGLGSLGNLYQQAVQTGNIPLQNYLAYGQAGIGAGQGAANFANQAAQNQLYQSQLGFNQSQTMGQQFGQALQGVSTGWGNAGLPSLTSGIGWGSGSPAWSGYNATGFAA